jgi:putative ABC transport system ATP-binding protein
VTLLSLKNVTKRFQDGAREIVVLDDVSLDVDVGELVGIYGERRSGKTTLLSIAGGLEVPDGGTVSFGGHDIVGMSVSGRARLRRRHGIALASGSWRPVTSGQLVLEHVAVPLTCDGPTLGEAEVVARHALEQVGGAAWAHVTTDRLSASERIRVELARALVREPRMLLVDEPGAGLSSPSDGRELYALLRSLAREFKVGVVIASEGTDATSGVDRFMTLDGGRLRSTDSRRRVVQFPERRRQDGLP